MVVGVLRLNLSIPEAMSLKDKRRAVKSVKDRLGARHNVSVAEVEDLELYRSAVLGVAMVSNDRRFVDSCLAKIVDEVRMSSRVNLEGYEVEFV
jgi:uncharacterized protein YlxP (DUF503 family)